MELSIKSAFSTGGLVGHLAYLLLVVSMLMRSMVRLRILVIASALVAIAYDFFWLKDPVGVFWETLLVTVNVVQIAVTWHLNRRTSFTEEERSLIDARLSSLDRKDARSLLNMGLWVDGAPDTVLTEQGQPVPFLVYLVSGRVDIIFDGQKVGSCGPGNFIGEMSLIGGETASATAVVAEPSRYWMISTDRIRALRQKSETMIKVLESGIALDLRHKILSENSKKASSG